MRPPSIASNTLVNLAGLLAPIAAALVGLPLINRHLGTERVGFLTLTWALIGYFSLFDLGIGRALTRLVAERLVADPRSLPGLIWTGMALMLGLGVAGGLAMGLAGHWLVASALKIPLDLQPEAVGAVWILALTVPLVVTTAGLRGVLEAQGRFLVSNAVRAPLGVWLFLGPLLVVPFGTRSLAWVVALLSLGRLAAWVAYAVACLRGLPGLLQQMRLDRSQVGPLLRFGGWITLSNVVSPVMVYMDRFLLGSLVSLQAVAWYATPWELITKILLVPGAVVGVLFPFFSGLSAGRLEEAGRLNEQAVRYMALVLFPATLGVALFAREGLLLWLGAEYAAQGTRVAQILALGVLANGIAYVPCALLQGSGRPDLTAKIHVAELPLYLALVLWLTSALGVAGTALAWALRTGLDLVVMQLLARVQTRLPALPGARSRAVTAAGLAVFALAFAPLPLWVRALLLLAVLLAEALLVWRVLLERDGLGHVKARVARALGLGRTS